MTDLFGSTPAVIALVLGIIALAVVFLTRGGLMKRSSDHQISLTVGAIWAGVGIAAENSSLLSMGVLMIFIGLLMLLRSRRSHS